VFHDDLKIKGLFCSQSVLCNSDEVMVQVYENTEVKKRVANAKPYQKWVAEGSQKLQPVEFSAAPVYSTDTLMRLHQYGKLSFIHFCFMRFQAMQILNHLAVVNIDSFEGELSR
jgi:hypothetical protein